MNNPATTHNYYTSKSVYKIYQRSRHIKPDALRSGQTSSVSTAAESDQHTYARPPKPQQLQPRINSTFRVPFFIRPRRSTPSTTIHFTASRSTCPLCRCASATGGTTGSTSRHWRRSRAPHGCSTSSSVSDCVATICCRRS